MRQEFASQSKHAIPPDAVLFPRGSLQFSKVRIFEFVLKS